MIKLKVMGPVVAQHRPRITTAGKFPRTYPVKADVYYREKLYWEAKRLKMKPIPRTVPLRVIIRVYILRPKSISATKRFFPTVKPDIDNYEKMIFDGLNGLIWEDDAQIVSVDSWKNYSDDASWLTVEVYEI